MIRMGAIQIGLTGWGDHHSLYDHPGAVRDKLPAYAGHFPIVELDSSFYAIPPARNVEKWLADTPESFQFVVKAYQGMTGHQRGEIPFTTKTEMFQAFTDAFLPMKQAGRLGMVLCQFPPWFDVKREHVDYLRFMREALREFDTALEFRHASWFSDQFMDRTLAYMEEDTWIHSICDEPQAGEKSIPFVPYVTDTEKTLMRFHGRNIAGWNAPVNGEEWRDVRYLYDYSRTELSGLAKEIQAISGKCRETCVVFNNNSGGHAAANAKQMIDLLGIEYHNLAPRQLDLFQTDD